MGKHGGTRAVVDGHRLVWVTVTDHIGGNVIVMEILPSPCLVKSRYLIGGEICVQGHKGNS